MILSAILFGDWPIDATPFYIRWFYRLKTLVCLIINRESPRWSQYDIWVNSIPIAILGGGVVPGFNAQTQIHWFECIIVGRGVFKNWWADYYADSD